jgi:predicted DNA-binding transcriptional regulator AlpA
MPASSPIQFPRSGDDSASLRAGVNATAVTNAQAETPTNILGAEDGQKKDPLLTAEAVAQRLNVTKDWVWDHSSRKAPYLPVIRMGDGTLRYRASRIEEFIDQRERLTQVRRKRA